MNVLIFDTSAGKLLHSYSINITKIDNTVTDDKEYFDEAWRCAVEDGLAKDDERAKYRFELVS